MGGWPPGQVPRLRTLVLPRGALLPGHLLCGQLWCSQGVAGRWHQAPFLNLCSRVAVVTFGCDGSSNVALPQSGASLFSKTKEKFDRIQNPLTLNKNISTLQALRKKERAI